MKRRPSPKHGSGDRVRMTEAALENYGTQYVDRVFVVAHWYNHYVSPADMANDATGHPGYDDATGDCLYHLEGLNFDLYDWEITPA